MVILITGLLVHLLLLINLRFEAWPEMLIYPYLLNHGFKLYQDIINPYPLLFTYFLAGFFSIVKLSVFHLQLLTWIIITTIDVLIFFIASKLYGTKSAIIALIFFIIFQPLLDGNGLWYDLALTPLLLLAFYFRSPLWLSLSFFVKQSVIWLFPLFWRQWKKLTFVLAVLFFITLIPFISQGNINDYLFWPWRFAFTIFPSMPGHKDFGSWQLWLIALMPFAPLVFLKKNTPFLWTILSFLFIFPRFGLFHLQPALAFASLSLASSLQSIKFKRHLVLVTCYLLLVALVWLRQIKLFWHQPPRFFEPDILAAADKLKTLTDPHQPIFMLNAPDQLLFLSNRLPTKPWATTFPWYLELPGMQNRLIQSIKDKQDQAVLFGAYQNQGQFIPGSYRPSQLNQFVQQNFPNRTQLTPDLYLLKL